MGPGAEEASGSPIAGALVVCVWGVGCRERFQQKLGGPNRCPQINAHPEPLNVTFLGNGVSADVISESY